MSDQAMNEAVNIHFFNEPEYRERVAHHGISVSMFHGIADKQIRKGEQVQIHDFVLVPGPLWINNLVQEGVPRRRIFAVGYPKLDSLFRLEQAGKPTKKTVLYAPTHSNSCSSYPKFAACLDRFPNHVNLVVSLHPYDKLNHKTTLEELAAADLVISDTSSVLYEAWALGKPVLFPDWLVKDSVLFHWPDSIPAKIYREQIGYHADSFEQIVELIDIALQQGIDPEARRLMNRIIPEKLRGKSAKLTACILRKIAGGQNRVFDRQLFSRTGEVNKQ